MDPSSWLQLGLAVVGGGAINTIISTIRDRRKIGAEGKKTEIESVDILEGAAGRMLTRMEDRLKDQERREREKEDIHKQELVANKVQIEAQEEITVQLKAKLRAWHDWGEQVAQEARANGWNIPPPPSSP